MPPEIPPVPPVSQAENQITRVVVADPNTLYRAAVRALLSTAPDIQVVGEASDRHSLLALLPELPFDLLLLEPEMRGVEALAMLRELQSADVLARTVLLSGTEDPFPLLRAIELGAKGVVMKKSTGAQLLGALAAAAQGRVWLDEKFVHAAFRQTTGSSSRLTPWWLWCRLTPRQRQIVTLVLKGLPNKAIAHALMVGVGTVNSQLHHIYIKLAICSRRDLEQFRSYAAVPLTTAADGSHLTILGRVA